MHRGMGVGTDFLYLASASPRRAELLTQIGVKFVPLVFDPALAGDVDVDESVRLGETASAYVCRVTRDKLSAGLHRLQLSPRVPAPVLAADTTLELEGKIIGKPKDLEEAHTILSTLSGREHRVLTAVALARPSGAVAECLSVSCVRFKPLSSTEISDYVSTGEAMGKAGAYGIQGRAALFVENISGSYSGIVGLSLYETGKMLREQGFLF